MLKKIPIGIEDFKEAITQNCYYIDKTKFIEDILNDGAKVKLFCRPRRFGKTLNMSVLKYFFDIENKDENRKLFDGLYIENSPYIEEQGQYPVIFLSMKGITALNWNNVINSISEKIFKLYSEFDGIINSSLSEAERKKFQRLINQESNEEELKTSLTFLTRVLYKHYNKKVIVLIDEYDSPIMNAYEKGYYTEMIDFIKAFYGDALKTNEYLQMGVLTGIIRVAQAGIFSDLNNFINYSIFNEDYNQSFGLLEKEVEEALNYYEIGYEMPEVKRWYDGYNFSGVEIYNPWSILNFIKNKKLKSYWVNTSGNALILNMLLRCNGEIFNNLDELIEGKEIVAYISESIRIGDNLAPNHIWELMLFSGYLTVKEQINNNMYIVKIPNKEIQGLFKDLFINAIFREKNNVGNMIQALLSKNIKYITSILKDLVINTMSFYDTDIRYENTYQTLISGFLYSLDDYYIIYPNIESGYGRADIILIPRMKNFSGYIFELKRATTDDMKKEADKALNQIESNKYDTILKKEGIKDIVKIGLVFDGKRVETSYYI